MKRWGDANARFASVDILVGDTVGRLANRAVSKFRWTSSAAYVELYFVKRSGVGEPTAAEEAAALKPRLQVHQPLSSGAWLVALVTGPPAGFTLGEVASLVARRSSRLRVRCSLARDLFRVILICFIFPTFRRRL